MKLGDITYIVSQYNCFICRICANKGNLINTDYSERLVKPCSCTGINLYCHIKCLKHYIETSTCANAYEHCLVCNDSYKIQNTRFDFLKSNKLFKLTFTFELVKWILIILGTLFATVILILLFNKYVYDFIEQIPVYNLTFTASVLILTMIIFLIIGNLIAGIRAIKLWRRYNMYDKYNEYTKHNYDSYLKLLKLKFCKNNCFKIIFVSFFVVFIWISFMISMFVIHLNDKKNQIKNKYYNLTNIII